MLLDNVNIRIWLYTEHVDMRKQFDGLAALAQSKLGCRANSGELFVFINRKRTQIKVLYYNQGGYCLWSKRLERGHYQRLQDSTGKMPLDWAQLQCLIGGIHWQKTTRNKRL